MSTSNSLRPRCLASWPSCICVVLVIAGLSACSFDSSGTPAACEQEGSQQNGFVCRDGVWEVDEDGSQSGDVSFDDVTDTRDADDGHTDDTMIDPDSCEPRAERDYCDERGLPCSTIDVDDPCLGRIEIDCTSYIDFDESLEHCGGCGNLCTGADNAAPACDEGSCAQECDAGWVDANDDLVDGCETQCEPTNGGVETCGDDIDNDCDGLVDEGDADNANTYWEDSDGDTFGNPSISRDACEQPSGYVDNDGDCDDGRDDVNPGASEVCDGAVDEDCDGAVDEDCPCTAGETRDCGLDEGVCELGEQTCDASGMWGGCNGGRGGSSETCDGLDNDCDSAVDEEFPTVGTDCSDGVGECEVVGEVVCNADEDGVECDATANPPSNELCDGLDNDCDGIIDNGFGEKGDACTVGEGACERTGVWICKADGTDTVCDATPGSPTTEICGNDTDDDCDGEIDEDCTCNYDSTSEGVCSGGISTPNGGCDAPPTYEDDESSCDQFDNDCDGVVDEGCRCDFDTTSTGVCSEGVVDDQGFCTAPPTYASPEMICDNLDNDCDGQIDEGCDDDGDGYCDSDFTVIGTPSICPDSAPDTADDCDDTSDRTHPGAAENESATACRRDVDLDGYGDDDPPSGVDPGGDCDDGNPATYDGAPEICDNEDNNCDGSETDGISSSADAYCDSLSSDDVRCAGVGFNCCEIRGDGDFDCDFETTCANGSDDDGDGLTDCEDPDCDGLSCGDARVCFFDTNSNTGSCEDL